MCRRADSDPQVIVDFEFERGLLFVVVRNLGRAAGARREGSTVRQAVQGPRRRARDERGSRLFKRIRFLAPGKEIRTLLDSSAAYFARKEPTAADRDRLRTAPPPASAAAIRSPTTSSIYRDLAYVPEGEPDA